MHFTNEINYRCQIRLLLEALKYRLILKNVYKAIKFKQSTLLKPYSSLNTKYRAKAKKLI